MKIYLGLDCGGSKTVAIAADKDGNILGRGLAGAANPLSVGLIRTTENIVSAINNSINGIDHPEIESIYIGMAGGKPQMLKEVHKRLKLTTSLQKVKNILVDHDLRIALYSALPEGDGVVLIAGTGSAAWTVDKEGNEVLVSGWNHILGETGGYEIGIKAIIAATRFYDGRGPKTSLLDKIIDSYQLESFEDISIIIRNSTDSPKIASLAPAIIEAANEGDKVAIQILEEMIDEMDISLQAAVKRAHINDYLNIVLIGGMFNMNYPVKDKLMERVHKWFKEVTFVTAKEEPARTALRFALVLPQ